MKNSSHKSFFIRCGSKRYLFNPFNIIYVAYWNNCLDSNLEQLVYFITLNSSIPDEIIHF